LNAAFRQTERGSLLSIDDCCHFLPPGGQMMKERVLTVSSVQKKAKRADRKNSCGTIMTVEEICTACHASQFMRRQIQSCPVKNKDSVIY